MDTPPLTEEYIKDEFERYVETHIQHNTLYFSGSVDTNYMITNHKFGPLGEKIKNNQTEILRLLKLLYDYWYSPDVDEMMFVDLVSKIFVTASTIDEYGPPFYIKKVRFIPEDTIYFHLLATIHLNIESLVETYSQIKDDLQFLTILLMRAMEEKGITGKYLMLEKEYKSLFGEQKKKFDLGVDEEKADVPLNIPPFISLSNTSLHDKITMGTGLVMKSSRKNSARYHPYPSRTGRGRTGRGGGRRTRKYRRKTRTKKNLHKCKTHKKHKTRRGRK